MFAPSPSFASRHIAAHAATLTLTWTDGTGEAAAPTGAVAVVVVDATGAAVSSGAGTVAGTTVTYALTAAVIANVAWLTVTWTDTASVVARTWHEVVGAVYVSIAAARLLEPSLISYSAAEIGDSRSVAEAEAERLMRLSFVCRYARIELSSRTDTLLVPWQPVTTIRSVTPYTGGSAGTVFDAAGLAEIRIPFDGALVRQWGWPCTSYVIEVEHGYAQPPADLRRAVARRTAFWCRQATTPTADQQARMVIEDGRTIQLATASRDRTGDDTVDAIYRSYRHNPVSVA